MDDLIKRQDAITAYCEHECGIKGMTRENCGCDDCGTIFDDIPPAQRWIPVSERLPKKGKYLVTGRIIRDWYESDKIVTSVFYDGEFWTDNGDIQAEAWMPLPEPWKGE